MNNVTYACLNKVNEPRIFGDDYLNDLYEYFEFAGEELEFEVSLTKEDFGKIFGVIYDALMLKVEEEIVE